MSNTFRRILFVFAIIAAFCIAASALFFSGLFRPAREIENVDHLTGQRIGVILAYEGDYVLSDREDITLCRYDTEADMIVALFYRQVDAVATTLDAAQYVLSKTKGLRIAEEPIDANGMATMFQEDSELMHEFNDFLAVYRETDEYRDYVSRCDSQGYYDGSPVTEETGTGKVIRLGYCIDYVPIIFYDTVNNCVNGSEADIFRRFANYMNYRIEWIEEGEVQAYLDLPAGKIDAMLDGYSDVYREECELDPTTDMSDAYRDSQIVLIEVADFGSVSVENYVQEVE